MSWERLSLHFRQTYEGGYRYLDKCGELILAASKQFDFMTAEVKVSGAKLEIPEEGITATIDTHEMSVAQEFPGADGTRFEKVAEGLAQLVNDLLQPQSVMTRGFVTKSYWPMKSDEAASKASLHLGGTFQDELAKAVGMVPARKNLDLNFASGSLDFHVLVRPVTFEKVSVQRFNPSFGATREQRARMERLNKKADRIAIKAAHAIMMELGLVETDPPAESFRSHFGELEKQEAALMKAMVIK